MGRKTNALGIELIKKFEGFRADAYVCPAGVLTIGYGHTATAKAGQTIGVDTAERLLRADVEIAESAVERHIEVSLTDNQFAALVSFTFNLGAGSLKSSTLRKKLNIEEYDAVPSEMARWVRAGGRTLAGLVQRRAAEGELFLTPESAPADSEPAFMPQRVESVDDDGRRQQFKPYLYSADDLERGHVDDRGDEKYQRLSQNVPDGYVYDLQIDLRSLGFASVGNPDGAFGSSTKGAVREFQAKAGLPDDESPRYIPHPVTRVIPPLWESSSSRLSLVLLVLVGKTFPNQLPPGKFESPSGSSASAVLVARFATD